jgi:hypothetical protein
MTHSACRQLAHPAIAKKRDTRDARDGGDGGDGGDSGDSGDRGDRELQMNTRLLCLPASCHLPSAFRLLPSLFPIPPLVPSPLL